MYGMYGYVYMYVCILFRPPGLHPPPRKDKANYLLKCLGNLEDVSTTVQNLVALYSY